MSHHYVGWDSIFQCPRDSEVEIGVIFFPCECSILSHELYYVLVMEYLLVHAACPYAEDKKLTSCCLGLGSKRNFTFFLHLIQLVTVGNCILAIGYIIKSCPWKQSSLFSLVSLFLYISDKPQYSCSLYAVESKWRKQNNAGDFAFKNQNETWMPWQKLHYLKCWRIKTSNS